MAWTTPKTWASGYVVLASDLNTHLRDNLNVTAPAVLTTAGDILYASGANTPARLAKSTTSTQYLANTGTSNAPAWNEVALDTGVSGTLPVGNGGTGATTLTANGALVGNGTSAIASVDMSTKGGLLAGDGSGNPSVLAVGSNDEVLIADSGEGTGMKWGAAAGGGNLILVGTVVASNDATVVVTGLDSTFDVYLLALSDIVPVTDGRQLLLRVGDSTGVDSGAADYGWHVQDLVYSSNSYAAAVDSADSEIQMPNVGNGVGGAAGEGIGAALWLTRPGDGTTRPHFHGTYWCRRDDGNANGGVVIAERLAVITLDRIQISFSSGNVSTGRMSVFGLKHS
jgi:hypothetical protein